MGSLLEWAETVVIAAALRVGALPTAPMRSREGDGGCRPCLFPRRGHGWSPTVSGAMSGGVVLPNCQDCRLSRGRTERTLVTR